MALDLGTICPYTGGMDVDALIDDLAEELGVSAVARKKWRQRGVPHRWRLPIIERAAERGVELTGADFERVSGAKGVAA